MARATPTRQSVVFIPKARSGTGSAGPINPRASIQKLAGMHVQGQHLRGLGQHAGRRPCVGRRLGAGVLAVLVFTAVAAVSVAAPVLAYLVVGDRVKIEMSPYDMDKARIVYRL